MGLGGERGSCGLLQVRDGLRLLAQEDLGLVAGDELVQLRRLCNQLEAEITRRVAAFDSAHGYSPDYLSTQSWLRGECKLSPSAASERVRVARKLSDLTQTADAFASGDIGFQHAALITRVADETGEQFDVEAETIFVTAARDLDPWRLRIVAKRFRDAVDPDGSLTDADRQFERRRLHLSQSMDGLFYLNGILDAEGGAVVKSALDALTTPSDGPGVERSSAQVRADQLVEMARRLLDAGNLPEVGGQKPHIAVTASLQALRKELGAGGADLDWSLPVPAETARRLACDASVSRILLGAKSEILDVGQETRVIPRALMRALIHRDHGCRFPGCDKPWQWTDGHHIVHWIDGGPTKLGNLILLCRRHHRRLHEEGWRVRMDDDGVAEFLNPWSESSRLLCA